MILFILLDSIYSQVIAKIEMSGRDAMIAAIQVNRFPSSETTAMIRAELMTLSIKNIDGFLFYQSENVSLV